VALAQDLEPRLHRSVTGSLSETQRISKIATPVADRRSGDDCLCDHGFLPSPLLGARTRYERGSRRVPARLGAASLPACAGRAATRGPPWLCVGMIVLSVG
jgi:hypothetical protein